MKEGKPQQPPLQPQAGDVLIVVDVQWDFLPGGALGVQAGDEVVAVLNRGMSLFARRCLPVVLSRDWHPADHCSFRARGGPWPPHCIAGSEGAAFAVGLAVPAGALVVSKATGAEADAYSAFSGTGLADALHEQHCTRIFVGGLATDYCVLATVKDARAAGFAVVLLEDAVRAVDLQPGDGARAIAAMRAAGARLASVTELGGEG